MHEPTLTGSGAGGELERLRQLLADSELREAQLASLLAAMPDMIVRFDRELRPVFCNRAVELQLGEAIEALLGRRPREVGALAVDAARSLEQALQRVVATGRPVECEQTLSVRREMKHYDLRIVPECDDTATASLLAIVRDISDRRRGELERVSNEEQLAQQRAMEAVATLAGGVAHDLNNLLAGLQGIVSLLDLEEAVAPAHRCHLRSMEEVVRRGVELSRQLQALARRRVCAAARLDLEALIGRVAAVVGRACPQVEVEIDLAADLDAILAEQTLIEQALVNLCLSVAGSTEDGGTLRLRAANATLTREHTEPFGAMPGRFVELTVANTGCGLDAAARSRIFEPFFISRVLGRGAGLGLAPVWATVRNHGGLITVASAPGQGSVFTLHLPAAAHPPAADAPLVTRPAAGTGMILVVDDEPSILELHARLLRSLGYETLTADSGRRAVELLTEHRERVALVLLDLTMPDLSGALTFDTMRAIMPEVKVLLCSGFASEAQVAELVARGCKGFIQKPFSVAELAGLVQALV